MIEDQLFSSVWDAIEDTPEQAAKVRALSESLMKTKVEARRSDENGTATTE